MNTRNLTAAPRRLIARFGLPDSDCFKRLFPGLAVSVLIAVTAQFLSEHYGAPAMLMALLLGLALNFLAEEGTRTLPGVEYSAKTVLRLGVALLGARISADMLAELGAAMIALVVAGVVMTILFALVVARFFGRGWRLALLTGGAVAICGASAAMAIAAVLPKTDKSERNLAFTVLSVTLLSTIAMIAYPPLSGFFGFSSLESGVFLGGTIHDVAQVVGAGFSVSPEVGETATLVKLIRVSMLAPVVLIFSLSIRASGLSDQVADGKRPPLLPGFVLGFLLLAILNSFGLIPAIVSDIAETLSRWALLAAIAAVGIKTSLVRMLEVGGTAIALIVVETVILAAFILTGVHLIK
ncbi:YeiH family protein [Paracoccus alkanivorans]|uniref:Putative sulfate exporter family transporter n=1 Tax=Paracoccus alkanivorans TaxID=2116655 RepID=A0A3M0MGX5_9RHOB|nr:putative sulfate exporter family transporter [Paracoccus alkanivorans]RMC36655.1 putative sulfate exporter family transporter [Paracoccus alkanivorans]